MICSLIKLLISNAMDSDRPFSRFVARHVAHCRQCREFAEVAGALEEKLVEDAHCSGITLGSLTAGPITLPARPFVLRPAFALATLSVLILGVAVTVIHVDQGTPGNPGPQADPVMVNVPVPSIGDSHPLRAIDGIYARELATLSGDARAAVAHVISVFPADWGRATERKG